ncbi:MFS transporter [Geoalkalibacter halelectricus]|uniref:MFS transporter n=1 Tax=Geoalkalibacter halelectricus TaxID=2847045 RepID=A0ABY5ZKE2_9BACT|nr:MFS transporter [Geoalkalibacter halelectricus]MDO3378243.1 MFS transporter [Geoalkalibacter halelectricus]UWZ79166.1 MFS transporter [Geoalkalibacter halelectricus]
MRVSAALLMRVFLPFCFAYFLSYLFRTVNAVIAPDLVADLALEPAGLGLLTAAYFLAFAAFQLPLGLLLDRFGPRRVEAALLLVAAAGALLFARAESLNGLLLGRALIGLGVSACLMAAFKAFSQWLPPERLPLANGIQMVSGGLGALAATAPVEAALHFTDWRGIFTLLGWLTLAGAALLFFVVPEGRREDGGESFVEQFRGLGQVVRSFAFWRIAPWAFTGQAAYLSIQGLWSGPWLREVAGRSREETAFILLLIALAMTLGYFFFGALAERLGRRGVPTLTVAAWGMGAFMLVQALLLLHWTPLTLPLWLLFGFCGTACILPYAALAQTFPRRLVGRANSSLNLLVFSAAFGAQWAVGVVIGLWPQTPGGAYAAAGYRAGFGMILLGQILAALWYLRCARRAA